MFHFPAFQL